MSFALPTTITVVDKYRLRPLGEALTLPQGAQGNGSVWRVLGKYETFKELVHIARMEGIFNDPQSKLTLFIPLDLQIPKNTLKACWGYAVREKDALSVDFETARTIIDSLIIPGILSTTMMMQSALTRYRTRNIINTITTETPHCVQFEPHTYNKPPFGIVLNGKARILTPDMLASNGIVHTVDVFPY